MQYYALEMPARLLCAVALHVAARVTWCPAYDLIYSKVNTVETAHHFLYQQKTIARNKKLVVGLYELAVARGRHVGPMSNLALVHILEGTGASVSGDAKCVVEVYEQAAKLSRNQI